MEEIWKDIVGYKGIYQVSNVGRVRSIDRVVGYRINGLTKKLKGKIKIPYLNTAHGYYMIQLFKNNIGTTYLLHRVIAMAFISGYKEFLTVNHIDGNKINNNIENLEWVTQKENIRHSIDNNFKVTAYGENLPQSKLNNWKVKYIRYLFNENKMKIFEIKIIFNVSYTTIFNVCKNKSWLKSEKNFSNYGGGEG